MIKLKKVLLNVLPKFDEMMWFVKIGREGKQPLKKTKFVVHTVVQIQIWQQQKTIGKCSA
jgi:hypothetical protein